VTIAQVKGFRTDNGLGRWESATEWPILGLALVYVFTLILPLAQPLPPNAILTLNIINWIVWGLFAIDYAARLWLAQDRKHFFRTHIFDLLVVLVPAFRLLRLIKVVSILIVFMRRARHVPHGAIPLYVAIFTVILLGVSSVLIYNAEQENPESSIDSLGDAIWWAMTTVTTVGYGDTYPVTGLGRFFAVLLMLSGITLLGTVTASAAAWFIDHIRQRQETKDQERSDAQAEVSADVAEILAEVRALRDEMTYVKKAMQSKNQALAPLHGVDQHNAP